MQKSRLAFLLVSLPEPLLNKIYQNPKVDWRALGDSPTFVPCQLGSYKWGVLQAGSLQKEASVRFMSGASRRTQCHCSGQTLAAFCRSFPRGDGTNPAPLIGSWECVTRARQAPWSFTIQPSNDGLLRLRGVAGVVKRLAHEFLKVNDHTTNSCSPTDSDALNRLTLVQIHSLKEVVVPAKDPRYLRRRVPTCALTLCGSQGARTEQRKDSKTQSMGLSAGLLQGSPNSRVLLRCLREGGCFPKNWILHLDGTQENQVSSWHK